MCDGSKACLYWFGCINVKWTTFFPFSWAMSKWSCWLGFVMKLAFCPHMKVWDFQPQDYSKENRKITQVFTALHDWNAILISSNSKSVWWRILGDGWCCLLKSVVLFPTKHISVCYRKWWPKNNVVNMSS